MAARTSTLMLLGASAVLAGPLAPRQAAASTVTVTETAATPSSTAWNAGAVNEYTIHPSCNATQHSYIKSGLDETMTICRQARDHILRWGNSSAIYQKYFGEAPTGEPLGWFTKLVDGDKEGILFRCDNIDGNCGQEGWAGHWRGDNATQETVICDLSYEVRKPLEGMCGFGYDVANGATNYFWASDLLHRLLHIPSVGEGVVEHYTHGGEKYPNVIELAETNSTYAARDSDTFQYFALEVYAHDMAVPGIGCPGTYTPIESSTTAAAASSASGSATATPASASATATVTEAAATSEAADPQEACQPHDDHWHCPPGVAEPTSPPA